MPAVATAAHGADPRAPAPPAGLASLATAMAGLAASVYLTVEHYTSSAVLACPENRVVNCAKVTTSSYSKMAGVPVALLGAVFFLGMAALCLPQMWRVRALDPLRIAGAGLGVVFALWFVWAELFRLDAICLWCTAVHAAALVLLGAVLWTTTGERANR